MTASSLRAAVGSANNPALPVKLSPHTAEAWIGKMLPALSRAVPKQLSADRLARIVLTEFRRNPKLLQCDERSLQGSILTAAQLGLEPGLLGKSYLIPYKTTCTFVPGWQGLVELAMRSGQIDSISTQAVFEGDDFRYSYGTAMSIEHTSNGEDDPAKMTHAYACAYVRGARLPFMEVWPIAKIWRHRDRYNKGGRDHYSFRHPEMYARKIPLLQVLKYLPKSTELSTAMELAHAAEPGTPFTPVDVIDVPVEPTVSADPVAQLRSAKGAAELEGMWRTISAEFGDTMPIEVEAAYNEMRESLASKVQQ
jgi:recombination protein RecT